MSDNQNQPQPGERPAPRPYLGRPEKQKNPAAPNLWRKPSTSQKQGQQKKTVPAELPPPTRKHDASHVKVSETHPSENSVFATGMQVRETNQRVTFTPSAPAAMEIARDTYAELLTDEPNLGKVMLVEYLEYFTASMLWFRFITLKQKLNQPLTPAEQDVLTLIQTVNFTVPEPILLQIREFGTVVTMNKQHLYPTFPPLPQEIIGGFGGYYGALLPPGPDVDNNIHNLYEEIPCLGVLSEAVRAAIGDAPPGRYNSVVTYQNQQPNQNLLGYHPLSFRRNEAKNLAISCGITHADFPCYPANTGICIEFLQAISDQLALTKSFKLSSVNSRGLKSIRMKFLKKTRQPK